MSVVYYMYTLKFVKKVDVLLSVLTRRKKVSGEKKAFSRNNLIFRKQDVNNSLSGDF